MSKFCIFCGAKPKDKSREHVIPQWLIGLTGSPKREAFFGVTKNEADFGKPRVYPFARFTFPACSVCNAKYGKLESQVKPVVLKILNEDGVTSEELSSLLDWIDKVRIGLWLGMQLLDKNYLDVESNFHIEKRIGQYDRLLIIQKTDRLAPRINFSAIDTPAFSFAPSAFSITINNFNFISVSSAFLFARRVGFPYVTDMVLSPDSDQCGGRVVQGRKRLMRPLMRKPIRHNGVVVYQPQFRNGMINGDFSVYDCDYVRDHSLDYDKGDGNIFVEKGGKLVEYCHGDTIYSMQNLPCHKDEKVMTASAIETLKWQNWLFTQMPDTRLLTPDQKRYIKDKFNFATKVNKNFISALQKTL
ncbi:MULTISPECIES: hypothetical protein [Vibrio]|uniref:hypothetical protein n=1 Tax=Vibrio TaxID=662 RepID=UPI001A348378|nr:MULTISPECIES: hypothetical protein [Vibrio]EGQ7843332.1 hypothetical protein [Vibrio alginolyticus]MCF7510034.1 hypothetical protein [Vibrio sp. D54]MCR9586970.1 hypothetical protein [Vibrio alginolyticus]